MNRVTKLLLCMITISMFAMLPVKLVWSADEDIGSSVYLVFDPATGEFVTEVDPDIVKQDQLDYELGRSSGAEAASTGNQAQTQGSAATPAKPGQTSSVSAESSEGGMSPLLLGGIVGLILLGGIVVMIKRNQQKHST